LTCDIVQAIFPKGKHKDFKGQRSLEGKKVAWMREFKLDKYFKVKTKFREVNNRQSGFNLLNAGKIDFWIDPAVLLEPDWKNLTVKKEDYEAHDVLYLPMCMAFANTPKGKKLAELWDSRMVVLNKSGEMKKIYKKHDWPSYPMDKDGNTVDPNALK
jgi:polar amino acid transport system substrate-binding protein